jgi:hypothetical protein
MMPCHECQELPKVVRMGICFMVRPRRLKPCKLHQNPERRCCGGVAAMCRSAFCTTREEAIRSWDAMQEVSKGATGMKTQFETAEYLRYDFTRAELAEHAISLARKNQELAELDLRQKHLQADINAGKKAANEAIAQLAGWISHGFDYRMIPCFTKFNDPVDGKKTTYRKNSYEFVKEADMDAAEIAATKQEPLPFDGAKDDCPDPNGKATPVEAQTAPPADWASEAAAAACSDGVATNGAAPAEPEPGEPGAVVDAEFPDVEPEPGGGPAIASQAEMYRSERKRQSAGKRA